MIPLNTYIHTMSYYCFYCFSGFVSGFRLRLTRPIHPLTPVLSTIVFPFFPSDKRFGRFQAHAGISVQG